MKRIDTYEIFSAAYDTNAATDKLVIAIGEPLDELEKEVLAAAERLHLLCVILRAELGGLAVSRVGRGWLVTQQKDMPPQEGCPRK